MSFRSTTGLAGYWQGTDGTFIGIEGGPVEPGGGGGGTTSDLMRPEWDHVINVGPSRTYTTVEAGVTAARTMPYAKSGKAPDATGLNVLGRGGRPVFARTVIELDPGTYNLTEILDIGDGIDLVGLGDSRGDVVVRTTTVRYNLRFYGSMYCANLTMVHDEGAGGNNYCMHGSTVPGMRDFTAVFDNVRFIENNTTSYGIAGWDMPPGMHAVMYRCRFESTTGHGIVFHDMPGSDITAVFLECESDAPMAVGVGTYPPYDGIGEVWVIDCTKLDGTPIANTLTVNEEAAAPTTDSPPLPENGMTVAELARYFPTKVDASPATLATAGTGYAATALTAGRVYYVPLPPMPWSAVVAKAQLMVHSAAGTISVGLYLESPGAGKPSIASIWSTARTATTGLMDFNVPASYLPQFFDVGMKAWLGIRVNSGACTVSASTSRAAETPCWYEDGFAGSDAPVWPVPGDMTQVPNGTAVPWGALVTA